MHGPVGTAGGVDHALRTGMTTFTSMDLDAILPRMERRADNSLFPTERARILNLAGDLCFDAGQRERALVYYDQAIDIYLALGMYASVAAVCQKLVRLSPNVVRARCTLRSEEHTSELQSQSNLVCRLLLEKKKDKFAT